MKNYKNSYCFLFLADFLAAAPANKPMIRKARYRMPWEIQEAAGIRNSAKMRENTVPPPLYRMEGASLSMLFFRNLGDADAPSSVMQGMTCRWFGKKTDSNQKSGDPTTSFSDTGQLFSGAAISEHGLIQAHQTQALNLMFYQGCKPITKQCVRERCDLGSPPSHGLRSLLGEGLLVSILSSLTP